MRIALIRNLGPAYNLSAASLLRFIEFQIVLIRRFIKEKPGSVIGSNCESQF